MSIETQNVKEVVTVAPSGSPGETITRHFGSSEHGDCKSITVAFGDIFEDLQKLSNPSDKSYEVKDLLNADSGLTPMTIRNVIGLAYEGKIIPYEQNRGIGRLYAGHVKKIAEEMEKAALGEMVFSVWYVNGTPVLKIANAHHRLPAVIAKYELGEWSKKDLDYLLSIRVVHKSKHLDVYRKANKMLPHTASNDYQNADFIFGKLIHDRVFATLTQEEFDFYKLGKNYPILAYMLFGKHCVNKHHHKIRSYMDIYGLRGETKKISANDYGNPRLSISDGDIDSIVDSLKKYYVYVQEIKAHGKEAGVRVGDLINKKGWMGVVVTEWAFVKEEKRRFPSNPKILANKVWRHHAKIGEMLSFITGGSVEAVDVWIEKIARQLNKNY